MTLIPTAIGTGQRLEQFLYNQDIFDTPGTSSWTHPSPGNALEVQVTLVGGGGGGGGNAESGQGDATSGSAGTPTIWDHDGSPITATSGGGGAGGNDTANHGGAGGSSDTIIGLSGGDSSNQQAFNRNMISGTHYGYGGSPGTGTNYVGGSGGTGQLKSFRATVTSNINVIIGNGGLGGTGTSITPIPGYNGDPGGKGAVIVSYAKAATGIPSPVAYKFEEEWLDWDSTTNGTGSWSHPKPGTAITMTVIAIGGAGGNTDSVAGGTGTKGGTTTFNGETAEGGDGGTTTGDVDGVVNGLGGVQSANIGSGATPPTLGFGRIGVASIPKHSGDRFSYSGGSGAMEIRRMTVTGNVNYTVGEGGAGVNGTVGDGNHGGIILKYSRPV